MKGFLLSVILLLSTSTILLSIELNWWMSKATECRKEHDEALALIALQEKHIEQLRRISNEEKEIREKMFKMLERRGPPIGIPSDREDP